MWDEMVLRELVSLLVAPSQPPQHLSEVLRSLGQYWPGRAMYALKSGGTVTYVVYLRSHSYGMAKYRVLCWQIRKTHTAIYVFKMLDVDFLIEQCSTYHWDPQVMDATVKLVGGKPLLQQTKTPWVPYGTR